MHRYGIALAAFVISANVALAQGVTENPHIVTPIANVQCCNSRGISRPGLLVACYGRWPGRGRFYADC